jgi:hypothetical protein
MTFAMVKNLPAIQHRGKRKKMEKNIIVEN